MGQFAAINSTKVEPRPDTARTSNDFVPNPDSVGVTDLVVSMIETISALIANGNACDKWLGSKPSNSARVCYSVQLMRRDCVILATDIQRLQRLLRDSVRTVPYQHGRLP
jgi:hypothetical protein